MSCTWNKFAPFTTEPDFAPRHGLEHIELLALFPWNEEQFLQRTEGSAIRRTGYEGWQRNIAIALGNAGYGAEIVMVLSAAKESASELVKEHIQRALDEQHKKAVALP